MKYQAQNAFCWVVVLMATLWTLSWFDLSLFSFQYFLAIFLMSSFLIGCLGMISYLDHQRVLAAPHQDHSNR